MSFAVSASAYDRFMGRYSGPLAPLFADLAGVVDGQRALDVGCGPGALTSELVTRLGPAAVAAVDPSESFVTAARERNPGVRSSAFVNPVRKESMSGITHVGRVIVPVGDQDAAIAFYTHTLSFELIADVPYGDGERWVEVAPPAGGAALALVPPRGEYQAGRMTGIALATTDARAVHEELAAKGVDVDPELMGGDGTVPLLFFFRDHDANTLMVVESA